jgi:hypothetical protein
VVQKGAGAGKVFLVRKKDDLNDFEGPCLWRSTIHRCTSGSCRSRPRSSRKQEHRPAIWRRSAGIENPGNRECHRCRHGNAEARQGVTLVAGDDGVDPLRRIISDIITQAGHEAAIMEDVYEYRRKRYILVHLPLNLVDPLMDDFRRRGAGPCTIS